MSLNADKSELTDNLTIPVWLHATQSFYKKLNRVAKQCGLTRYDALSRGLDALLREAEIRNSALNIKSPSQSEVFRRTMGQVSRNYWATVSPEEKRRRAQNSARARWGRTRRSGEYRRSRADRNLNRAPENNQRQGTSWRYQVVSQKTFWARSER